MKPPPRPTKLSRIFSKIETAIDAAEVILSLAPETNGHVAVKAWSALGEFTGRDHTHLAKPKEEEKIRFRDIQAQPRKIISSPTWSGLEDEHVSYNAGYTNVHELIPWRTVTGRQQFYQDHQWMRDFLAEPNRAHFNEGFTVSAVGHALDRMHQGAAGIDGTSKKWTDPLRETLIPRMAALFS